MVDHSNYNKKHRYTLWINRVGILGTSLDWASINSTGDWSWGHDDSDRQLSAYISFDDPVDALRWKLEWWQAHQDDTSNWSWEDLYEE